MKIAFEIKFQSWYTYYANDNIMKNIVKILLANETSE